MFKGPARLIRTLHAERPALIYATAVAVWLVTTTILLYFLRYFMLTGSGPAGLAASIFGLATLAIHSAVSVFLGDGWKIHFRKLERENIFISFLGRFE